MAALNAAGPVPVRADQDALRSDLDRFTFLLGGSDGEKLFRSPRERWS
jgi:hypothetical protein